MTWTFQAGLHPDTWTACARIVAENDPLGEGPAGIRGADLCLVAHEAGQPVGFIAGFAQSPIALCSFVRVSKASAGSRRLLHAMFTEWLGLVAAHGLETVVAGVPTSPPRYRRLVGLMLEEAAFEPYAHDAQHDWFRRPTHLRRDCGEIAADVLQR